MLIVCSPLLTSITYAFLITSSVNAVVLSPKYTFAPISLLISNDKAFSASYIIDSLSNELVALTPI